MTKVLKETKEETAAVNKGTALAKEVCKSKYVYNNEEGVKFKVSTGSLALDIATGGGISSGSCIRVVGPPNQGKTSELLEIIRNLFLARPKSRGVFVKAEGRLSDNIQKRSGLKFVFDPEEWVNHTVLVLETNVYEVVAQFIVDLIKANFEEKPQDREQFAFMIDSLDGLILEDDLIKSFKDSHKVAGPQVITKKLLQKILLQLNKGGHLGLFTSQMTAQPRIDTKSAPSFRLDSGSGGNGILHGCDHIWEFLPRWKDDNILENPLLKYDPNKNKIIGHTVNLMIKKSDNEQNNAKISYSILHGRWGAKSIWREREVGDLMVAYGWVTKAGSWLKFKPHFVEEFRKLEPAFPEQIQGMKGLYDLLEQYPTVMNNAYEQFVSFLSMDDVAEVVLEE